MHWRLDKTMAICPQICEQLCATIVLEKFENGSKLPSVRKVAFDVGVNPNTVQKSFELLEQRGIIYSIRSSGWYVGNTANAKKYVAEKIFDKTNKYFNEMAILGMDTHQTKNYLREWLI